MRRNLIECDSQMFFIHPAYIGDYAKYTNRSSDGRRVCKNAIGCTADVVSARCSKVTHAYDQGFPCFL